MSQTVWEWIPLGRILCTRPDLHLDPPDLLDNVFRVTFPRLNRSGSGSYHANSTSTEIQERVEVKFTSSVPLWPGRALKSLFTLAYSCFLLTRKFKATKFLSALALYILRVFQFLQIYTPTVKQTRKWNCLNPNAILLCSSHNLCLENIRSLEYIHSIVLDFKHSQCFECRIFLLRI
jgi:hypothetical protein